MENEEIVVCQDIEDLNRQAAERFARLAAEFVDHAGRFTLALSGGSTPKGLYARLATPEFQKKISWQQVCFFWGDERCVPPDHPESNFRMAREALLSKVPVLPENIYRMPGENEPEIAALEYEEILKNHLPFANGNVPRFDLILLGLGDDGHTASLFPGNEALQETRRLVVAPYVEKIGAYRLTLTLPVLNSGSHIFFLVAGEAKAAIVRDVLGKKSATENLPAQRIRPKKGRLVWLMDREAASLLNKGKT